MDQKVFATRKLNSAYYQTGKAHGVRLSLKEPHTSKAYQVIDMGSACLNGFGNGPTPGRPASDPFSKILSSVIKELENFQNQTDAPCLVTHTATSVNPKTIEFAQKLIDLAPKHIGQGLVSIQTTGTDAVFAAVDAAMQYAKLRQKGNLVLVGGSSYHGSGDIAFGRNPLTLMRLGVPLKNQVFYPPYLPFFKKQSGETDQEYVANLKKAMEKIIKKRGPNNFAAILIEPVSGSSRLAQPASSHYLKMLKGLADKHDFPIISDEIMCGLGRIGGKTMWAYEAIYPGLKPDIITHGKALGGGVFPIATALISGKIARKLRTGKTNLIHSHTFSGNVIGSIAGLKVLKLLSTPTLSQKIAKNAAYFEKALTAAFKDHPRLHFQGMGLLQGAYVFEDKKRKKQYPKDQQSQILAQLKSSCIKSGVNVYAVNTLQGIGFLLVPPLTITRDEIDEAISRLQKLFSEKPSVVWDC